MSERTILGIRFFCGSPEEAVSVALAGGLVVVPSAPVLIELDTNAAQREALVESDLAITDSAFMILIWRLLTGERLTRVSGLEYLRLFLKSGVLREPSATFWIMPTVSSCECNLRWLQGQGLPVTPEDTYIAPFYPAGQIRDEALVARLTKRSVKHIIIALGGGTQERLGFYLKRNLPGKPGIHCIGAAIGFCSGDQVNIPVWADWLYLSWLLRCLYAPSKFVPRYWRARRLASLMFRYRADMPPLVTDAS